MKDINYIFPAFSFYDRTGIQDFLEKKAMDGWMLEKLGALRWKFRRMEPKLVHFAVTYFPKASAFDPKPSEEQEMFLEFCAHSGWKLVASSAQLQIFCNEQDNPVPIETDPKIELENIHRTAKKMYLPAYYMLLPVGILPWLTIYMAWSNDPVNFLSSNIYFFNILTSIIDLLLCGTELTGYYRWRAKAKRAAEDGEFVPTRGRRYFQIALVILMLIGLAIMVLDFANIEISLMMIVMLVLIGITVAVSVGATKLMKKMNISARKNRNITYAIIAVMSVLVMGLGTFGVIGVLQDWNPGEDNLPTYEFLNHTWTLQRDEIPLKIQDMTTVDPEIYSYEWIYESESALLARRTAHQRPRLDMLEQPDLNYTIVEVKAPFLYDFCLREMLKKMEYRGYSWCDPEPWGAMEVYGAINDGGHYDLYIICFEDRIVSLETDWTMTEEQMQIAGTLLK